ncbi:MAG: hypothetical protein WAY93_05740 [Atopobiaceae bacterium]
MEKNKALKVAASVSAPLAVFSGCMLTFWAFGKSLGGPAFDDLLGKTIVSSVPTALTIFWQWTQEAKQHRVEREMREQEAARHAEEERKSDHAEVLRKLDAVCDGVQTILKAEIIHLFRKCVPRGYITLEEREYAAKVYADYHSKLDGNGDGTYMFEALMALPLEEHRAGAEGTD